MTRPRNAFNRRQDSYGETHRELIEAAVRLISENGASALSIASVARGVGIDRTTVYYHFPGREALLEEVKRWSSEQLAVAFANQVTQEERIDYTIRYGLENAELIKLWIDDFISGKDVRAAYPHWDAVVAGLREQLEAQGSEVDPEIFFLNILSNAIITPRIYRAALHPDVSTEAVVQRFKAEHLRLLRGAGIEPR